MKVINVFVICGIIVLASLSVSGAMNIKFFGINNNLSIPVNIDILDQKQIDFNPSDDLPIPVGRFALYNFSIMTAQSFKPTINMLTRVELYVGKNDSTIHPFLLSIKKDLTGPNLVQKSVNPSVFLSGDYSWIEFDFNDIWVEIGETYYIVCQSINETGNWYLWAAHNDSESYPNGCAWVSTDGGNTWSNQSKTRNLKSYHMMYFNNLINSELFTSFTWDTCFKTYGRQNLAPTVPNINGPVSGKIGNKYDYTIISVDPEMDDLYYLIDWGDGSIDEWIGPYNSDDLVIVDHTWTEEGEYTIRTRAKDIYGNIGDWSTLDVIMPKNKNVHMLPGGFIFAFGLDVDVKLVQLEPGEDYVDLEVLSKPLYIWENEIITINPGAFIRLYEAEGFFRPSSPFCFGMCSDWGIIG